MHEIVYRVQAAGVAGYVQVFGLFAGTFWALVCTVFLALRWRVPPVIATVPLVLPALVAIGGAMWGEATIANALVFASADMRAVLTARGVAEVLSNGLLALLALPAAMLLGLGGLAAGIRAPRAWGLPVGTFLLTGFVALLPLVGFFYGVEAGLIIPRVLVYGLGVVPVALALANGHPAHNGPEGGMNAAAAFACVVGASELAALSFGWQAGFIELASVQTGRKAEVLGALAAELGGRSTLAWLILLLAGLPSVFAAFRGGPTLTAEEILAGYANASPWRGLGRFLGLGVWLAWALAMVALDPSDSFAQLEKTFG